MPLPYQSLWSNWLAEDRSRPDSKLGGNSGFVILSVVN
jgi:hypothetical protein